MLKEALFKGRHDETEGNICVYKPIYVVNIAICVKKLLTFVLFILTEHEDQRQRNPPFCMFFTHNGCDLTHMWVNTSDFIYVTVRGPVWNFPPSSQPPATEPKWFQRCSRALSGLPCAWNVAGTLKLLMRFTAVQTSYLGYALAAKIHGEVCSLAPSHIHMPACT